MNYVFIINPAAGKGKRAEETAKIIRDFFRERDDNINIYLSKCPGDAIRFGREYPIPEGGEVCFVACGGDGTFYETVNGAFGRPGASFAVYPCGSGNDFIKSIGGRPEDYLDLEKLVNGKVKVLDAMDCGGHICSNVCNIGLDSVICDRIPKYKHIPGVSGSMAYNVSVVTTILGGVFSGLSTPMKFTFDDGKVLDGKFLISVFGNGKVYGGGYHPVPDAQPDDGIIDFCTIADASILKIAQLIGIYKKGEHIGNPIFDGLLTMHRCKGAVIESSADLTVCVDGEIFKSKSVEIKILPASLPFRVPDFD
ncbi:MAG: hypothetical protein IJ306_03290 [Oscillospiraceae bacterium]|nr:hypothetical protein [Oscillospiraceae bacterium]